MNKKHLKRDLKYAQAALHDAKNCLKMSVAERKKAFWRSQVKNYEIQVVELTAQLGALKPKPAGKTVSAPKVLLAAAGHLEDRAVTYDNAQGERSIPLVIELFNKIRGKDLTPADGWLIQVLLKIVRANQGDFKLDNFEDLAAYAALWGEESANDLHKQH
ncbi:hypothetical protein vBKpPHS106_67 [Klebsiella phage VB_KpP_HS106]|nr:hypothetical protein vBKpPHS106_67 [Klebsiella phage VB_KpP_HS106]